MNFLGFNKKCQFLIIPGVRRRRRRHTSGYPPPPTPSRPGKKYVVSPGSSLRFVRLPPLKIWMCLIKSPWYRRSGQVGGSLAHTPKVQVRSPFSLVGSNLGATGAAYPAGAMFAQTIILIMKNNDCLRFLIENRDF